MPRRFTYRKYMGDDCYSYALFDNGRPILTGLSLIEARYYRDKHEREMKETEDSYKAQKKRSEQKMFEYIVCGLAVCSWWEC